MRTWKVTAIYKKRQLTLKVQARTVHAAIKKVKPEMKRRLGPNAYWGYLWGRRVDKSGQA